MLLMLALTAALGGADRHKAAAPAPVDAPRSGWSQPMQPASAPQDGPPPDMPQGAGPRATSGGPLFDTVAVAQPDEGGARGISVAVAGLAPGSFAELTELGGGHTILALVGANQAPGGVAMVSEGALQALGIAPGAGVRVRAALPSPQDQTALRAGGPASSRIDAPEVLLKALRKRVPQSVAQSQPAPTRAQTRRPDDGAVSSPSPVIARAPRHDDERPPRAAVAAPAPVVRQPRPAPRAPAPAAALRSGYIVQVAALSNAARANDLAHTLGGRVIGGGGLYRIQLGPYGDPASAKRARDGAAQRGYRDARVAHTE